MNKYEFEEKLIDIQELIEEGEYQEAVRNCDGMNLELLTKPRVLNQIARAYEKCHRYEEAESLLKTAKEYAPKSRGILFHLCNVAVKAGDLQGAEEFYDNFCKIAPRDSQRYVLQYRLSKAKGRPDDELIEILEILRRDEPNDHWLYILAQFYARNGRTKDAIDTCTEIDLWFDNGKYVVKAAELKSELTGIPLEELLPKEEETNEEEPSAEIPEEIQEELPEETQEELPPETEEETAAISDYEPEKEPEASIQKEIEIPFISPYRVSSAEEVYQDKSLEVLDAGLYSHQKPKDTEKDDEEVLQQLFDDEIDRDEHVVINVTSVDQERLENTEEVTEEEAGEWWRDAVNAAKEAAAEENEKRKLEEDREKIEELAEEIQASDSGEEEKPETEDEIVLKDEEAPESALDPEETETKEKAEPGELEVFPMEGHNVEVPEEPTIEIPEPPMFEGLPLNPIVTKEIWHFIIYAENHELAEDCARNVMRDISAENPSENLTKAKLMASSIGKAGIVKSLDHFLGKMTIIEDAASLSDEQLREFTKVLEKDDRSLLIAFTDTEENIKSLFERVPEITESFTAVYNGEPMSAYDLADSVMELLYGEESRLTREAQDHLIRMAEELLNGKKGGYRTALYEYAEKAREKAEKGTFFGFGAGKIDDEGLLVIELKHFRGLELTEN